MFERVSLTRVFTYHMENPAQDREYTINCKRKVVQFVYRWVVTIRHPVFDDVVSMSFLEVFRIFRRTRVRTTFINNNMTTRRFIRIGLRFSFRNWPLTWKPIVNCWVARVKHCKRRLVLCTTSCLGSEGTRTRD
jgi:hypothetical protein